MFGRRVETGQRHPSCGQRVVLCFFQPGEDNTMNTATTNTVRLHRVLRATPERLYRAFVDADALAKWLPPHGFTGKVHEMDARVNGRYTMSFTNFSSGHRHGFTTTFLEMKPGERLATWRCSTTPACPVRSRPPSR
jgi:hypothetical protein